MSIFLVIALRTASIVSIGLGMAAVFKGPDYFIPVVNMAWFVFSSAVAAAAFTFAGEIEG